MTEDPQTRRTRAAPFLILLAVMALGALALGHWHGMAALKTDQAALAAFTSRHYLAAVILFLLAYTGIAALSLPVATLMSLTGGYLFGTLPGAAFNLIGATSGAVIVFLAARAGFGARFAARLDRGGGRLARVRAGLREGEVSYLLVLRLVPAVPFFLANLLPAMLGVSLRRFALTSFFGMMPATLVFAAAGAGLGRALGTGGTPGAGLLFRPAILAPLLGLAALALLPVLIRKFGGRR